MKHHLKNHISAGLLSVALAALLTLPLPSLAASVALSTVPLATSTTSTVKPNVMFILDDSGSMDWDYLPDWANDSDPVTGRAYSSTPPLFRNSGFNGVAYNPAVTYTPPVLYNADGTLNTTTYPNIGSPWTAVKNDAYGVQSTASTNLVTSFPDVEWCTDTTYSNCLRNDNLILPGTIGGVAYTTSHSKASTGTGSVATGNPDAPTTAARLFGPYYYTILPGEYCDSPNLKNCQTTQTATFSYPASVRWCNSSALTNCQGINSSTYRYPRYPTKFFTPATTVATFTTNQTPGVNSAAAVAPANGALVISAVAQKKTVSLKCNTTLIGKSPAWVSSNSATASIRLDALYTSITTGQPVNGYTIACSKTGVPTTSLNCSVAAPAGASKCSGGFTLTNITATTNTGPTGGSNAVTGVKAAGTITFTNATSVNPTGFRVQVNGTQIMTASTPGVPTSSSGMATWVKNNSSLAGYTVTASGSTVTITANAVGTAWNINTIAITQNPATPAAYYGSFIRTDIVLGINSYPYPGTSTKAASRTDCAGTTCTYIEEMTNFANWWTYYHTRMQAMKTSVSRAFKTLDNRFRVGFNSISYTGATDGTKFLHLDTFELAHKNRWFTNLFASNPTSWTPLRGAISNAGKLYAKKISGQSVDPVQYSCQQNFTILSTDGYWNTNLESSTYGPFGLTGSNVGNLDGGATARPMYEGPTASSGSLADVAKYYYDTDLRSSTLGNCAGGVSTDFPLGNPDVCTNNVFVSSTDNNVQQHMTTFTMGLGIDGTLDYTTDYLTATSGDYYNLKNGLGSPTVNWPDPIANSLGERIDDLWHAAVNGHGTYFSAKDPDQIISGFSTALSSITAKLGSSAAAATSTLNPVAGNNFAFVASYTTVKWQGNLESRSINVDTGVVSTTATWCVENVVAATCASPGTIVSDTSGSSTIYNCVVPGATASTCASPGVFDSAASTCTTQIANACTGTMPAKVGANTDTRTIYTANSTGAVLFPFDAVYAAANATYFNAARISTLTQWPTLTAAQQATATGVNLLNYLRGQNGFEDRTANIYSNRLYRSREAVLGDPIESQPSFIANPVFSYPYPGYSNYKTAQANRAGTVYMGANDGMMHAFEASTGMERWAYVPSMVIGNLWKLADTSYSTSHRNYVNGSPITSDVCTANCSNPDTAVWKTILVAGLNGGGRGYYALDITNPDSPTLLWEFTTTSGIGITRDDDLGYSFGQPVITRKADGTWVVLVTSGYNNSSPGSGIGYLFVLNAGTGAIISKISTGVGSTATPSGLSRIAGWNIEPAAGNLAGYVYGGDLLGNVWRFDINSTVAAAVGSGDKMLFASLKDPSGNTQPVTTTPTLGKISGKRIIFIGTGKYLETSDLSNTQIQTQYAIKDDDATSTLVNPRNSLVNQTITNNPDGTATRLSTGNAVNFTTGRGWFVDFPDNGERATVDSKLVLGTLLVPTIVPSSTICSPGGYGWLNYIDYKTGGAVTIDATTLTGLVSVKYDSTIVGFNVLYVHGTPKVGVITSNNPTPVLDTNVSFGTSAAPFVGKRVIWRELIQ